MTSYKATRNLLMDIPAIEKTVFLIDRKDLDNQTKMAFQSYADNDLVDVNETENVGDLIKKLGNDDRQMIVTTIQKMQVMLHKRLKPTHPKYQKIKNLKIAFVVDECHRAVTPGTKREFERFFTGSLWFGFTGTPRFPENPYPQMGDLPRTTAELYGPCLHKYTIKEAIHDEAVLGFMVENLVDSDINPEDKDVSPAMYQRESHMLMVLNTILNRSNEKFGIANGKGKTYEAILTTTSIKMAQRYYDLLKKVVRGETPLQINEDIRKVLPDFSKFAITYSVTENEEESTANQDKMKESLDDYNRMFGTHFGLDQLNGYNQNLNDRLARKMDRFHGRSQQLDLVIVVDRLLTGFDAPCLSTLFMDRQPMQPHDIIQALSRTNRLYDKRKQYGQIVTFQAPAAFKTALDDALKLFSAGGIGDALAANWEETEGRFIAALAALRTLTPAPADAAGLSPKEKRRYIGLFQRMDRHLTQLKAFTTFEDTGLEHYGITWQEYEEYLAYYHNILDSLPPKDDPDDPDDPDMPVNPNYEPLACGMVIIDYEYLVNLLQDFVFTPEDADEEEVRSKVEEIRNSIAEFSQVNEKLGSMMSLIFDDMQRNRSAYFGRSIAQALEGMKRDAILRAVDGFGEKWFVDRDAVL
jgi:type I restriction enzyme R subunit